MYSTQKLIVAGQYFHHYEYNKPISYGFEKTTKYRIPTEDKIKQILEENKTTGSTGGISKQPNSNIYRSKKAIKLLLQANTTEQSFNENSISRPLFVTLTFAENVQQIKEANYLFTKFVKNLNYNTFGTKEAKLKYLTVIEFQQRGAIHYHTIFFNPLDISKFYDLVHENWTHGFSHLKKIHNQQHLINYVHKDITKLRQKKELHGHKAYFCSKGLLQPTLYRNQAKIETLLPPQNTKKYTKTFRTDTLETRYTLYKTL